MQTIKPNGGYLPTCAPENSEEDIMSAVDEILDPEGDMPARSVSEGEHGLTAGEFRDSLMRLAVVIKESSEAARVSSDAIRDASRKREGWASPVGIGVILSILLTFTSGLVAYIHLSDQVQAQAIAQTEMKSEIYPALKAITDTLTRMEQRDTDQDLNHRVTVMEKTSMYEYGAADNQRVQRRK
jgi:hypothetical protein